jgi:hypothetical protein
MRSEMRTKCFRSIVRNYAIQLAMIGCMVLAGAFQAAARPRWILHPLNTSINVQRTGHSAVFDPTTKTMVVFGGVGGGLKPESHNDVLQFSASGEWSTLIPNGAVGSPPGRWGQTAVYDSSNNRLIIFGGYSFQAGGFLNDLWVLTNANGQGGAPAWTQLLPSGPAPAPRWDHHTVYDQANNRMIVFAGDNNSVTFPDVWVLEHANGLSGTPVWTQLSPTGGPPAGQSGATAVYDTVNNVMIVFGGASFEFPKVRPTNAVWTLSHANGLGGAPKWTNLIANGTPNSPGKRWLHSAVYDAVKNRMIVYAGGSGGPYAFPEFNDVWMLANANGLSGTPAWTRIKPAGTIPARRGGHSAIYDPATNRMLMFAGDSTEAMFFTVWTLTNANGLN